jgi:hypothetical protein
MIHNWYQDFLAGDGAREFSYNSGRSRGVRGSEDRDGGSAGSRGGGLRLDCHRGNVYAPRVRVSGRESGDRSI